MNEVKSQSRKEKLQQVAKSTREALYAQWTKNGHFEDYNSFCGKGRGILSEAMGLTAVMLMYIRFSDDEAVWTEGKNDFKTMEIISESLKFIHGAVAADGYSVKPLCQNNEISDIINKENGYIDTITWVLSSSVLITYAISCGMLSISDEYKNYAFELLADSLAQLMHGQLDNGSWGFSTDSGCKTSLYFTYAAAAALADCFDYLLGELEYYSQSNTQDVDIKTFYDQTTLDALDDYYKRKQAEGLSYYPTVSVETAINATRSKLQEWLLKNVVPSLPKLSSCIPLEDTDRKRLGIAGQTSSENITLLGGKDYINLYYAFYAVDILTTSSADKRYKAIAEGESGEDTLSLQMLKDEYRHLISGDDYQFFFESDKGAKAKDFVNEYVDQAIHSTRMNFNVAQRTGEIFWNGDKGESELTIQWEHETHAHQKIRRARTQENITEPTLVPMALRANTVYCYYVIERADVTVDKLFDMICDDRSSSTAQIGANYRIENLWDAQSFSLSITERAIEALVDYCDYLEEFGEKSVGEQGTTISSIDDAVEEKIRQYLSSEKGMEFLSSLGGQEAALDVAQVELISEKKAKDIISQALSSGAVKSDQAAKTPQEALERLDLVTMEKALAGITGHLERLSGLPGERAKDDCDRLVYWLLKLFEMLSIKSIVDMLDADEEDPERVARKVHDEKKAMVREMAKYAKQEGRPGTSIAEIYRQHVIGE